MKFIELLKHKTIRPKQIKEIEGLLICEDGYTSVVYEYINLDNQMRYIGLHKAAHKAYWSSGTDKDFQKVLMNPNSNLKLIIHAWGSMNEMKQLEHEMLVSAKAATSDSYYNKHNGFPGIKQIDFDKIEKLRNEIDWLRDDRRDKENEFEIINFDYLSTEKHKISYLQSLPKIQVRYETIDRDNLEKIKSKIRVSMGSTEDAKPPVYLQDVEFEGEYYEMLLISGNHTITSYYSLGGAYREVELPIIVLGPDIHSNFTNSELFALGNELNSEKYAAKPYTKEDAEKECLRFHELGNTWKCSRNTVRMIKLGLTENQVATVYENVEQSILNDKRKKGGWNVMDYEGEHRYIVDELIEKNTTDDVFVCDYSGAAMKLQNILISYVKEQIRREINNEPKQKRILCYVRFTKEKVRDSYWPKLKSDFQMICQSENITPIDYIELEMYTKDTRK